MPYLSNNTFRYATICKCFFLQKADGVRDKMADFLYTYLQRRFGLEQMIIEWGYNLHDACQRYEHDEHIGLFAGVLREEVSL